MVTGADGEKWQMTGSENSKPGSIEAACCLSIWRLGLVFELSLIGICSQPLVSVLPTYNRQNFARHCGFAACSALAVMDSKTSLTVFDAINKVADL